MKKHFFILVLITGMLSCNSFDEEVQHKYQFIAEYSAQVTVGGVVGITRRTFKVGEVYTGTDEGEVVRLRIAPHTELNDDCPNSWCYQEFLDVPHEFLRLSE